MTACAVTLLCSGPAAAATQQVPDDLPDGVADAALRPPAELPAPAGWPFAEGFPGTSGTARLVGGSLQWSDFVFDDHGATGTRDTATVARQAPPKGSYVYGDPAAHANGADIFRLGVGLRGANTFWRVDWATLADATVPIAAFGIAPDAAGGAPTSWPAGAGVRSDGLVSALVVSSRGAWLVDAAGRATPVAELGGSSRVDEAARSFVVRLPRRALPDGDRLRVWAVSGVADAAGRGFAPVGPAEGARPGQPAIYDVGFNSHRQEPALDNPWMEKTQAGALTSGDVTPLSATVDWRRLATRETTPEPVPKGHTNRWYVSSVKFGEGVLGGNAAGSDGKPNLLGRILPYFVYVPQSYDGSPAPLTWMLHSLSYQHNQYGTLTPRFIAAACEDRRSICAGISGRSPEVPWFDEAELDFWETWRDLAEHYVLDPDRTVISGYSMGGLGTFRIGLAYPSVFAKAVSVSGGLDCGIYLVHGVGVPGSGSSCAQNGTWSSIRPSARWLPYVIGADIGDWASPPTNTSQHRQGFKSLGYRWRTEQWADGEHLAFLNRDRFASIAGSMDGPPRKREPGRVTFTWFTDIVRADLGLGPSTVYWLDRPVARTKAPGVTAAIDARSDGRPEPEVTTAYVGPATKQAPGESPKVVEEDVWQAGAAPAPANRVRLRLTNVRSVGVLGEPAGLRGDRPLELRLDADGESRMRLRLALAPATRVQASPHGCARAIDVARDGATITVGRGSCTIVLTPPAAVAASSSPGARQAPCVSRRGFVIRVAKRRLRGQKVRSVRITLNGRPLEVLRGRRIRAFVPLRGLPRGTHVVRISVRLHNGRLLRGTRTYRTCQRPHRGRSTLRL